MLQPRTPRKLTLQQQRDMMAGIIPEELMMNDAAAVDQPVAGASPSNQYDPLFNFQEPQTYLDRRQMARGQMTPNFQVPNTASSPVESSNLATAGTTSDEPQTLQDVDKMYQSGQITKEQADQYELLFSNGSTSDNSRVDSKGRLLTDDPSQYNDPNDPSNFPLINASGSDLGTELYSLGMSIGAKPGTRGRGLGIIGAGGAAALDIAGTIASGIGFQKRNQHIEDYNRKKELEVQYDPNSQTSNANSTGGLSYGEFGGLFYPSENTPKYPDGGKIGDPEKNQKTIYTSDKKDPRLKTYNDSLNVYNSTKSFLSTMESDDIIRKPSEFSYKTHTYSEYLKKSPLKPYKAIGQDFTAEYPLYKKPVQKVVYSPKKAEPVVQEITPVSQQTDIPPTTSPTVSRTASSAPAPVFTPGYRKVVINGDGYPGVDNPNVTTRIRIPYSSPEELRALEMDIRNIKSYKDYKNSSYYDKYKDEVLKFENGGMKNGKYEEVFYPSKKIPLFPDGGTTGANPNYDRQLQVYNRWNDPSKFISQTDKVLEGPELDAWYAEQIKNNPSLLEENGDFVGGFKPIKVNVSSDGAYYATYAKPGKYLPPAPANSTPASVTSTTASAPKQGYYLDANTGQKLPIEQWGSPGQVDYQFSQPLEQFANSPEQKAKSAARENEIATNKRLISQMTPDQLEYARKNKMTAQKYFELFPDQAPTTTFKDGGTKITNKKQGDPVKFMYGGKMIKGVIKKIENGKIYL